MSPSDQPSSTLDLIVSQPVLARYLNIEPGSVSRLAQCGMPKTGRNSYPLLPCVQWFFRRLKDRSSDTSSDLNDERLKLIRAQRIGQELANAATRAAMLDADLVATTMQEIITRLGARLDAIPLLAPELARLNDPGAISRLLFDACRDVRIKAAADMTAFAKSLADGIA